VVLGGAALCVHCVPLAGLAGDGAQRAAASPAGAATEVGAAQVVAVPAQVAGGAPGDTGPPAADAAPPPAPPPTALELELIELINRERTSRGIDAMVPDARLTAAARAHSKEMCELGYFDHRSPTDGLYMPLHRYMSALGDSGESLPDSVLIGENIYHISEYNHVFNMEFGHRAIMRSPSHRAAILDPRYTKVGVGVHRDARGELWATEMFLRDTP
jgi:uncharacterized protein YkwD